MAMLIGTGNALTYPTALAQLTSQGWTVVAEGDSGAQLKGPKKMRTADKVCLWLGMVGLLLYGLGLVLILIAVIDYALLTKPRTHFLHRTDPRLPA